MHELVAKALGEAAVFQEGELIEVEIRAHYLTQEREWSAAIYIGLCSTFDFGLGRTVKSTYLHDVLMSGDIVKVRHEAHYPKIRRIVKT